MILSGIISIKTDKSPGKSSEVRVGHGPKLDRTSPDRILTNTKLLGEKKINLFKGFNLFYLEIGKKYAFKKGFKKIPF
jgi:hypothetical protein